MTGFTTTRATLTDVETLVTLRLEMRREREEIALPVPEAEFAAQLRNFFTETIVSGEFISFIIWHGDIPAACSGMSIMKLPPAYGDLSGKKAYITNMYTRPEYRGRGLARKLLDALKEYATAEGCGKLELNASTAGYPLYKKYGFSDVSGEMEFKLQ